VVVVLLTHPGVGAKLVGVDAGPWLDMLVDASLQFAALGVGDDGATDLAVLLGALPFQQSITATLSTMPVPRSRSRFDLCMFFPRPPTNVSFVTCNLGGEGSLAA
jgi:hypothetical protein